MESSWLIKMLLATTIFAGLALLAVSPSPSGALAQSPPTPTNIITPATPRPGGGKNEGGGEGGTPAPPGAGVWGYVYDYSNRMRQPSIPVVLDGGGWQAETVSDSNGLYQFSNLGAGSAVLNLRLPLGTHAVAPDWPISLSGVNVRVDLGYYWGDNPPLPVLLSGSLQDNTLVVQVENRTNETTTGGLVDVRLPISIKASPAIQVSQGTMDYSEHRVRVTVGDIAAGAKATIMMPVQRATGTMLNRRSPGQAAPLPQSTAKIQIAFTYDQQITPQLIAIAPDQVSSIATPVSPTVAPVPEAAVVISQASTPAPLPITGNGPTDNGIVNLLLPILLVLMLGVAGWWSLRTKR